MGVSLSDFYKHSKDHNSNNEITKMCCYVIVTVRSLFWSILSITTFLSVFASFMSAHWLISQPITPESSNVSRSVLFPKELTYVRATGLFLRCEQQEEESLMFVSDNCRVYAHSVGDIASPFWVATSIFMACAILCLLVVALFSVWALCFQNLGKKSIFSVSGILQAIAGLCLIIGLVLFPAGWGSPKLSFDCGNSGAFNLGRCQMGWAYYAGMIGTFLSFLCALLSNQAYAATASDRVVNDIEDGKNPVCAV